METEKEKALQDREALIEMYKAGFLDGYKKHNKLKTKEDWKKLNDYYRKAFIKRFGKKITKELKKMKKK